MRTPVKSKEGTNMPMSLTGFQLQLNTTNLLLKLENVLIEVKLELFIAIVDAQLLKRVGCERLKTENVKHTDGGEFVL
jgi:hypothetical protein